MINRVGNALVGSMRCCVDVSWLPLIIKAPWVLLCFQFLKTGMMRSFQPEIRTQYGAKLDGCPGDSRLNLTICYRDVFEPNLSDLINHIVKPGDKCLDVGANTGYFTLLLAQKSGPSGKVIAIEASPGNVTKLSRNVSVNHLEDRVEIIGAACGDSEGEIIFFVHPKNDMLCRLELPKKGEIDYWLMGKKWDPITVPVNRLSTFVGKETNDISFIKLDIEGFEHRVVREILNSFTNPRLCVAIEAKAPHIRETLEPFEQAGFYVYDLKNDYKWMFKKDYKPTTQVQYENLYKEKFMVDVLLSREPIDLLTISNQCSE